MNECITIIAQVSSRELLYDIKKVVGFVYFFESR